MKASPSVLERLRAREKVTKVQKTRLARPPTAPPPKMLELKYYAAIRKLIVKMEKAARDILLPGLALEVAYERALREHKPVRIDASDDIDRFRLVVADVVDDNDIGLVSRAIAQDTSAFNRRNIEKMMTVVGVNPVTHEPWLQGSIKNFTTVNVNLISSIRDEFKSKVETTLFTAMQEAITNKEYAKVIASEFSKDLSKLGGQAKNRAKLIARDQIAKFNSSLNQTRQTNLGITHYTWSTSHDESVRESHAELDGDKFSWEEGAPSLGGLHPGQDYNCRCVSVAYFDEDYLANLTKLL